MSTDVMTRRTALVSTAVLFASCAKHVTTSSPATLARMRLTEQQLGVLDGANKMFRLPAATPSERVLVYQNGLLLRNTRDYTLSDVLLMFKSAPAVDDTLDVVLL